MKYLFTFFLILPICFLNAQENTFVLGKIAAYSSDKIIVEYLYNTFTNDKALHVVEVSESGEFKAELAIDHPTLVHFKYLEDRFTVYVEKNKDLGVFFEAGSLNNTIQFFEKDQLENNKILWDYNKAFGYLDVKALVNIVEGLDIPAPDFYALKDRSPKDRFEYLKALKEKEDNHLVRSFKSEKISDPFKTYLEFLTAYRFLSLLVKYVDIDSINTEYQAQYKTWVTPQRLNNFAALNHPQYLTFLDQYAISHCQEKMKDRSDYYPYKKRVYNCFEKTDNMKSEIKDYVLGRMLYYVFDPLHADEFTKEYHAFVEQATSKDIVRQVKERYQLASQFAVGNPAPNFNLEGRNGQEMNLNDFKGKKVYLSFWAKWCGPCKKEIINSRKNRDLLKEEDLVFVYVSLDEKKEDWLNHKITKEETGTHLWGEGMKSKIKTDYGIVTIPKKFLIDEQGNFMDAFPKSDEATFVDFIKNSK